MSSSTEPSNRGGQIAARVLRCPMCGKPIPAGTGLLNHYCTGKT